MKDEIKEILDYLKDNDNYIEDIGGEHKRIGLYEAKILLDYITNLQEENERLKEKVHNQKVANAYEIVQIDKLQTNIKTQIRRRKKEAQLKRQYKTRNEKAIEYIKSNLDNTGWLEIGSQDVEVLLNILQGKSDE